jgi:hypothetical protein
MLSDIQAVKIVFPLQANYFIIIIIIIIIIITTTTTTTTIIIIIIIIKVVSQPFMKVLEMNGTAHLAWKLQETTKTSRLRAETPTRDFPNMKQGYEMLCLSLL